jgi:hypothetical protein
MTPAEILHRKVRREAADLVRLEDLENALSEARASNHPCTVTAEDVAVARALMMVVARHPLARGTSLALAAQEACAALIGHVA